MPMMMGAADGGMINQYDSRATLARPIVYFGLDEVRKCSARELLKAPS